MAGNPPEQQTPSETSPTRRPRPGVPDIITQRVQVSWRLNNEYTIDHKCKYCPTKEDLDRWVKHFGYSPYWANRMIRAVREDPHPASVADTHWNEVRDEMVENGHDRESYTWFVLLFHPQKKLGSEHAEKDRNSKEEEEEEEESSLAT
ncbi:hypothetical protein AJ80_00616 [Polytolypa hystricis UAMH7299]|uniref:Uncharacterized protein n=1 Tax=Polytolypa hystricis (strain UAMH7299) TaxID=1447883 RepID=A0A2B7Z2Z7_POLH7|nr:hypothetical protein AJ80_00616 [Polytolypa hystricis UAMH7299]